MAKVTSFLRKSIPVLSIAIALCGSNVAAQNKMSDIEYYQDDDITNQIPYFDNRFRIDDKLEEVTLIFYRKSGTQPVILVRPDGSKLKINNLPEGKVQWFDDRTYDMIKIQTPMIGPWQVIGEVMPDSKIMVVSEITLKVTPLPEIVIQGETLKMEGQLFNGGKPITDPAFSDVLMLDVDFFSTNNSKYENFGAEPVKLASFRDDGYDLDEHARDCLFTGEFELDFAPGEWEPKYIIKMPMATRELNQSPIIVHKNPITLSINVSTDEAQDHELMFSIDDSYVDPDSILIQGKVTFPDKQVKPFSVMQGQGTTRLYNIAYTEPGIHRVKVNVFGETKNGREFRATVVEFSFNVIREDGILVSGFDEDDKSLATTPNKTELDIATKERKAQALAQAKAEQEAIIEEQEQTTLMYIVGGNGLVIIVGTIIFFVMRRNKQKK